MPTLRMFFSATAALASFLAATAAFVLVCSHSRPVFAQNEWPQFRGPDGQGHSDATGLPVTWSETENVVWKTAIPGEGHSSPVISDNQIWLTTAVIAELTEEEQKERMASLKNSRGLQLAGALSLYAVMIERDSGRLIHQIKLFEVPEPEPKHSLNSYASPTAVIAGDLVFFHFGTYGTACIHRSTAEIVWKNDDFHIDHQNGPGSSPAVWQDKLIIHFDGTDHQFIAAFDCATGKVAWKTDRSGEMDPTPELQKAYGTPLILETTDYPMVISPAANWVYGYDARDGKEVWKAGYGKLGFSTVPRPVLFGNTAYIATSYMQSRLLAVQVDGTGDVTETHIKWMSDRQIPQKPSLIVMDDRLYFVSDKGIVRCVDATTGEEHWFERLSGDYSASPLAAEGRIYFFGQDGTATVLADSREHKELAVNKLNEGFMASPAVAGKAMFLRTDKHLYRIENLEDK